MVYVFLPFMVLTLYTSIRDVDKSLQEASRSLGARPLRTFREVTLPLTKSGIISGSMLVFVLSLGVYVLPRILGNPPQWTLAVLIGNQVGVEGNIPYGATISIVLLIVVGIILGTGWYLTSAGRRKSL
jgi:ABC-type spermidine/putrescine transport system permease subunit I